MDVLFFKNYVAFLYCYLLLMVMSMFKSVAHSKLYWKTVSNYWEYTFLKCVTLLNVSWAFDNSGSLERPYELQYEVRLETSTSIPNLIGHINKLLETILATSSRERPNIIYMVCFIPLIKERTGFTAQRMQTCLIHWCALIESVHCQSGLLIH